MLANYLCGVPAFLMLISAVTLPCRGQEKGVVSTDSSAPIAAGAQTPNDLMLLGAKENGLDGDDVGPWHLKASFTALDEEGNVTDAGTYEEYWVSSTKYKRMFTGKAFTQTDYGTEKSIMRVGLLEPAPVLLEEARREFTNPLPSPGLVGRGSFEQKEIVNSGVKLECLHSHGMFVDPDRTYCLGADKPYLRIASSAMEKEQILHNRILAFRGRFIAGDMQFVLAGKRRLTAHLETVESLDAVDNAMFAAPADAFPVPRTVDISVMYVSAAVSQGMLLRKEVPEYPYFARQNHITGTVVLQATVGEDGHIKDVHAASGPAELMDSAADAVRHWLYRPYMLNGQPVEVRTTINVIFTLGR
jgi:TonB family protein